MPNLIVLLLCSAVVALSGGPAGNSELWKARDAQDRAALERIAAQAFAAANQQPNDAAAQYQAALASSTLAEVAAELRDKAAERSAAEAGMKAAERAVALKPKEAEYHRIWGTLCGQEAAAVGGLGALRYGKCALDEVNAALELDPKAPANYLSRGVGNYYLPAALGGGVDKAIADFQKACIIDPQSAEAHLWLGIALRKANRDQEARAEFEKAVRLNPARVWARQQLAKTAAN